MTTIADLIRGGIDAVEARVRAITANRLDSRFEWSLDTPGNAEGYIVYRPGRNSGWTLFYESRDRETLLRDAPLPTQLRFLELAEEFLIEFNEHVDEHQAIMSDVTEQPELARTIRGYVTNALRAGEGGKR